MTYMSKKRKAELAEMEAESQRKWLEEWLGASVKFNGQAVDYFNSQIHLDHCKKYNKPLEDVRREMVGKVVGGLSSLRTLEVDFGTGPESWATEWLVRV